MPTKAQPTVYVGGEDQAVVEKRRAYEEALDRLNRSLDVRQQRMFDPAMLAAAQELLSPGKSGSFWEAAGRAAGAYGAGQEKMSKEEQDIAQQQLQTAQMGLELERQRQSDIALESYLQGKKPSGPTAPQAAPAGGLAAAQPPVGPLSEVGQYGIQIMPPDRSRITGDEFIRLNKGRMPVQDLLEKAAKLNAENFKTTEAGTINLAEGKFYAAPKGELVDRQVYGYGPQGEAQTIKVPQSTAFILDQLAASGDPRYYDIVAQIKSGPPRAAKPAVAGALAAEPTEVPTLPTKTEAEASSEARKVLEKGRAETAVKEEEAQPIKAATARRLNAAASQVESLVKKNAPAFGYFAQPGVLQALGQYLGETRGNLDALDTFVQQMAKDENEKVTKEQLRARSIVARNLGEMELEYAKLFLTGQGAVSDNERKLIARVPGRLTDDPAVLQDKMKLIKLRSQFEIDDNERWLDYRENNPGKSISDYRRSKAYTNALNDYDKKLGKEFGFEPAVPTSKKGAGKFTPDQVEAARNRLLGRGAR